MTQLEKNRKWIQQEGGVEYPTHLTTLQKPEQIKRIEWLQSHVTGSVLDVGCNWGYVAEKIGAQTGIDYNAVNICKAKQNFPDIHFMVGDARRLPIDNNSYDTVVLADILEHLSPDDDVMVISEARRVAREKVLITIPICEGEDCAGCFKHYWSPATSLNLGRLLHTIGLCKLTIDDYFAYIEVQHV